MTISMEQLEKEVLSLPGAAHLFKIRDALYKGHAAVMVGSGFSRNADNGERLPTWTALAESMLEGLSSNDATGNLRSVSGTSDILRLAEEYAAVHGRSALDALVRDSIPDAGIVQPGKLHEKLLKLPWVDIFTTNYDTLLERAYVNDQQELVPKVRNRYHVVVSQDDIPLSRTDGRPRIVKLHGGFTSYRPFIVSEDDYRTYPEKFAPFVNMVQQSLLENVFCLLGFSGDDPNFLLWTGWVRDRLGKQTPPIFLITASPISHGLRLILERRYIFPIVIAELGKNPKDPHQPTDYRIAYGVLLDFLAGRPSPRPAEWARNIAFPEPKTKDTLLSAVSLLRHAHRDYPGWISPPPDTLQTIEVDVLHLSHGFHGWARWSSELSPLTRLATLAELQWWARSGSSNLLDNWAPEVDELLLTTLELMKDGETLKAASGGVSASESLDNESYFNAWRSLAIQRLEDFRRTGRHIEFNKWVTHLTSIRSPIRSGDWILAMHYQRVLMALEEFDFLEALQLALNWPEVSGDPYWDIRRAAILAELGSYDSALECGLAGLKRIRHQIRSEGETIGLLSREMWADMTLKQCQSEVRVRKVPYEDLIAQQAAAKEAANGPGLLQQERPYQVYQKEYSEPEQKRVPDWERDLERDPALLDRPDHPWHLISNFRKVFHLAAGIPNGGIDRPHADPEGQQYRNLVEDAAYATSLGFMRMANSELSYLVEHCCQGKQPLRSYLGLILRGSDSQLFQDSYAVLAKTAIADWPLSAIELVYTNVESQINKLIAKSESRRTDEVPESRIIFGMQLLSRLFGRLQDASIRAKAIQTIVDWWSHQGIAKRHFVYESYGALFIEVLSNCSDEELRTLAPQLFSLPVIQEQQRLSVGAHWRGWPEIASVYFNRGIKLDSNAPWKAVVDKLLSTGRDEVGEVRQRYLQRLDFLKRAGVMDAQSLQGFAHLVWGSTKKNELPDTPGFISAVLKDWPAPPGVDVNSLLDAKLSKVDVSSYDPYRLVNYLNDLMYLGKHDESPLRSLKVDERLTALNSWLVKHVPRYEQLVESKAPLRSDVANHELLSVCRYVSFAMYRTALIASTSEQGQIRAIAVQLRRLSQVVHYQFPYLLLVDLIQSDASPQECVRGLRRILYGNDLASVMDCTAAVGECITNDTLALLLSPTIVDCLLQPINWKRLPHLIDALRVLERISRDRPDRIHPEAATTIGEALARFADDASYSAAEANAPEWRKAIPEARILMSRIAANMGWAMKSADESNTLSSLVALLRDDAYAGVRLPLSHV